MKTLKLLVKLLAICVVIVVGYGLVNGVFGPKEFRIERSIAVNAPAEKIFPLVTDFHRWPEWSPWENVDPSMKRTYSGAESGQGAEYEWNGNKDVGSGRMKILETVPSQKISIQLDFKAPFEANNFAEFSFVPTAGAAQTTVTWAMYGPQPFLGRVISAYCSMDKMVGGEFEKGLSSLKAIAEK